VYDKPKRERTLLITLLSPLLFFAPEVHLRDVERLWTDEVIIETVWKTFMNRLLGEWEDVILWVIQIRLDQICLYSPDSY
jgi:transposase